MGGVSIFILSVSYFATHPKLPSQENPILFYSNQTSNDLKILFQRAIQSAKQSIFLQIYGCTDPDLLNELEKVSKKNIAVEIFYDKSGSKNLNGKLSHSFPLFCKGLMHKKILIIDNEIMFLGSTNLTPTSLRMHDNIVVGIHQKELCYFLNHDLKNHYRFQIGPQKAEFWHLPDFQNQCLTQLLEEIKKATTSIHLALFTFTHPLIVEALINAKNQGVDIKVALDFYSASGASKKTADLLKKAGISLKISQSGKLLHYKWGLFDQKTLWIGSANWTKSAFEKNEDCILTIQNLTPSQSCFFLNLWDKIIPNSL